VASVLRQGPFALLHDWRATRVPETNSIVPAWTVFTPPPSGPSPAYNTESDRN
jgi:hypothetical protein